jgi:hypothetical protein
MSKNLIRRPEQNHTRTNPLSRRVTVFAQTLQHPNPQDRTLQTRTKRQSQNVHVRPLPLPPAAHRKLPHIPLRRHTPTLLGIHRIPGHMIDDAHRHRRQSHSRSTKTKHADQRADTEKPCHVPHRHENPKDKTAGSAPALVHHGSASRKTHHHAAPEGLRLLVQTRQQTKHLLQPTQVQTVRQTLPPQHEHVAQNPKTLPQRHVPWHTVEQGRLHTLARLQKRRPSPLANTHRRRQTRLEHPRRRHDHPVPRHPDRHSVRRNRQPHQTPRLHHRHHRSNHPQTVRTHLATLPTPHHQRTKDVQNQRQRLLPQRPHQNRHHPTTSTILPHPPTLQKTTKLHNKK